MTESGTIQQVACTSSGWSGWADIGARYSGDIDAVARSTTNLDLFARKSDNSIHWASLNAGAQSQQLAALDGTNTDFQYGPVASMCATASTMVFGVTTSGLMRARLYDGTWGAWKDLSDTNHMGVPGLC